MAKSTTRCEPAEREVLAALARAIRNETRPRGGESRWLSEVGEHLALTRHWRVLNPVMARLSDKGLVRPTPNGAWVLTDAGRREVEDSPVTLPESPQQRRWREARELAEMHCEKMRQDLIAAIKTTVEMLNAREPVPAERWQACGHRLKLCCEAMAAVDFALNASNDPKDGPARGDTWITFWVRYGLIYRMPARRRNGVNGADRQGEDTPAVIDQVDLDELPEDTGAEAATSR